MLTVFVRLEHDCRWGGLAYGGLWLEAIAEAWVGMDEAPVGHRRFELAAKLAHVYVHRAVAVAQLASPYSRVQLVSRGDRSDPAGHRYEQLELAHRQAYDAAACEHETVCEPDLKLACVQRVIALGKARHIRKAATCAYLPRLQSRNRTVKKS
jgi:hypothetical protein